ncbi:unnamed protein product [Wuchereria bancrofti]|uniref:Uncharacterized protein n=1 Tax=Wuchereria bancrofti TaxID=6293 RepID=A0A3P7EQV7_WUCBA|nr:unnamed protein product [Wuchereria bancrofti]
MKNDEMNYPFYRTLSSEDIINDQQSMLESYSSQDFEYIFMPKQMNPKCFDILKDIVMQERTAVFDLKILTEVINCTYFLLFIRL